MSGFDMHIHTTASDGTLTVKEIITAAMEIGLEGIAITDHDTIDGLEEAEQLGKRLKFPVIPGIELSTESDEKEIHILGFFIDYHLSWVKDKLAVLQQARVKRILKMVDKLKKLRYDVYEDEIFQCAGESSVGRPHIALVLQRKGYISSVQDAFEHLIGKGCPAYVPRFKLTPCEAISFICDAGGVPVIAHPGLSRCDELILPLCDYGLKGIEVFHPDHNMYDELRYLKMAKENKLIVTGGSDFHGFKGSMDKILGSKSVSSKIWDELIALKKAPKMMTPE